MSTVNGYTTVEKASGGKWSAFWSSLMNVLNTLDYDHREHADAVSDHLRRSVVELEARLAVLEKQAAINAPTHPKREA